MRHKQTSVDACRHHPGMVDKVVGYYDTAVKIYGVAHGMYQVAKTVAPYVAAGAAMVA